MSSGPRPPKTIGEELFLLVQAKQGKAFISDAIEDFPPGMVIDLAEQTVRLQRELNADLTRWIREKKQEFKAQLAGVKDPAKASEIINAHYGTRVQIRFGEGRPPRG